MSFTHEAAARHARSACREISGRRRRSPTVGHHHGQIDRTRPGSCAVSGAVREASGSTILSLRQTQNPLQDRLFRSSTRRITDAILKS